MANHRMRRIANWISNRPRTAVAAVIVVVGLFAAVPLLRRVTVDRALSASVQRGTLSSRLTAPGVLKPNDSITYRSPLGGREAEITFLVAEGTRVGEGDLLVRLDTTDLQRELERAGQELRQAQVDLQVAEIDRQEGVAAVESISKGEGAVTVEETRTRLLLSEKKVDRLRQELEQLKPLMEKGFITREELRRTGDELEQAEEEVAITRRKAKVLIEQTHPRDEQRAQLQLAQKESQRENVRARLQEAQAHVAMLREQLDGCNIYARRPGMVVYEEYLSTSPRRKIRASDRVTGSQGLVTIPEMTHMVVDASITEADVHRVSLGQSATIRLEAFRDRRLTGKVVRIGTLARSSADRPNDEKRFDLIVAVDPTDAELRPEMTARVDVMLGERQGVLIVPINAIFEKDGLTVCHVLRPFGVETRAVDLGESNDAFAEVKAGLSDGDRVMLTDVAAMAGTRVTSGAAPKPSVSGSVERGGAAIERR